jgi:hypothetical protein
MKNSRRSFQRRLKSFQTQEAEGSKNSQPAEDLKPEQTGISGEERRYEIRDMGVLAAWIAGLCLVGGLAWLLTQPLRSGFIIHTVNRTLEQNGESRRLEAPVSPWGKNGVIFQLWSWYTVKEETGRAVVFPIMDDGIFAPYVVFLSIQGTAGPFIPLSVHAGRLLNRLPHEVLQTYVQRIESAELLLKREEKP